MIKIEDRPKEVNAFFKEIFPESSRIVPQTPSIPINLSDSDLIKRAMNAVNGEKFIKLLEGAWKRHYPSQSEADLAFCAWLAFSELLF